MTSFANDPLLQRVLDAFTALTRIPRPSKHEAAVNAHLSAWARARHLVVTEDAARNLIIDKTATRGHEGAPLIILQAHTDMVCVPADNVNYDPLKDPIILLNDGKTLRAQGTSLGADNGIGIALALALLDTPDLVHGPVRLLLTADEETGMTGASNLDPKALMNAYNERPVFVINLDWEVDGTVCNTSASGEVVTFTRPVTWQAPVGDTAFTLRLAGLQGGHSGINIHNKRANALRVLGDLAADLAMRGVPFEIADFHGGVVRNAIPASASLTLVMRTSTTSSLPALPALKSALAACQSALDEAHANTDPERSLTLTPAPLPTRVLEPSLAQAMLDLVAGLPNGVQSMSLDFPGLVETSCNLGRLSLTDNTLTLEAFNRSAVAWHSQRLVLAMRTLARLTGFICTHEVPSPAWPAKTNSALLPLTTAAYHQLTGTDMRITPVHAALECGWFARANPHADIIAIGPQIDNVHSPAETVHLDSLAKSAQLLRILVENIATT